MFTIDQIKQTASSLPYQAFLTGLGTTDINAISCQDLVAMLSNTLHDTTGLHVAAKYLPVQTFTPIFSKITGRAPDRATANLLATKDNDGLSALDMLQIYQTDCYNTLLEATHPFTTITKAHLHTQKPLALYAKQIRASIQHPNNLITTDCDWMLEQAHTILKQLPDDCIGVLHAKPVTFWKNDVIFKHLLALLHGQKAFAAGQKQFRISDLEGHTTFNIKDGKATLTKQASNIAQIRNIDSNTQSGSLSTLSNNHGESARHLLQINAGSCREFSDHTFLHTAIEAILATAGLNEPSISTLLSSFHSPPAPSYARILQLVIFQKTDQSALHQRIRFTGPYGKNPETLCEEITFTRIKKLNKLQHGSPNEQVRFVLGPNDKVITLYPPSLSPTLKSHKQKQKKAVTKWFHGHVLPCLATVRLQQTVSGILDQLQPNPPTTTPCVNVPHHMASTIPAQSNTQPHDKTSQDQFAKSYKKHSDTFKQKLKPTIDQHTARLASQQKKWGVILTISWILCITSMIAGLILLQFAIPVLGTITPLAIALYSTGTCALLSALVGCQANAKHKGFERKIKDIEAKTKQLHQLHFGPEALTKAFSKEHALPIPQHCHQNGISKQVTEVTEVTEDTRQRFFEWSRQHMALQENIVAQKITAALPSST